MHPDISSYLDAVTAIIGEQLGSSLVALYSVGSLALDDFHPDRSDIDIIAVSGMALSNEVKQELAASLLHRQLACPAEGLDFILFATSSVNPVGRIPRFEVSIASGERWPDEVELGGPYAGAIVDLAICREHGRILMGPAPRDVIGPVDSRWILDELLETVRWHRNRIHDSFHDPYGYNAVLNACRAWAYSNEHLFVSKTQGGEWVLAQRPDLKIVTEAIAARQSGARSRLDAGAVMELLDTVEQELCQPGVL